MNHLLKLIVCWIAFVLALISAGALVSALHLQTPVLPGQSSPMTQFLLQLASGLVLVVGMYPLARGLSASRLARSMALVVFLYIALGVNALIEGRFFTHFFDGCLPACTLIFLVQALCVGSALGFLFGGPVEQHVWPRHAPPGWVGRIAAAWLSWPLVYLIFGMCVAPIVVPYYNAGVAGLKLPHLNTILEVQLLRSVLFLAASLPFIAIWKGSRRGLWLALGLTHAVVVGLYGLVGATFFPPIMRIAHGIEMTCDGFAYAGLLVLLFTSPAVVSSISAPALHNPQPHVH